MAERSGDWCCDQCHILHQVAAAHGFQFFCINLLLVFETKVDKNQAFETSSVWMQKLLSVKFLSVPDLNCNECEWIYLNSALLGALLAFYRSLNGIIGQMEQFSRNLNDLSSKVEATHHTTSQGLEIGVRQREQQQRGKLLSGSWSSRTPSSSSFLCSKALATLAGAQIWRNKQQVVTSLSSPLSFHCLR